MNKYRIEYTTNGKKVSIVRYAEDAASAVIKLADQYGWGGKVEMVSAEGNGYERGEQWAQCSIDTEGGINWDRTVYADIISRG